jgi:hypothetical protein
MTRTKKRKTRRLPKGVEFMEQTWNKEIAAIFSHDIIGSEDGCEIGGNGREENGLTESIETKSDMRLKKAFASTFITSNAGIIAWGVLLFTSLLCLAFWKTTEARWISFIGAASFLLAIGGIFIAFVSQTLNLSVRLDAKLKGKGEDFFKEEEQECSLSKTVAKCYGFVKRVFNRGGKEAKRGQGRYEVKHIRNRRMISKARSCRRSPRHAFTRSSHDGDDSGDSDSGDPPGPLHHTAPLKLSQTFHRKSNSPSLPRRSSHASGCWRMSRRERSHGRWQA